MNKFISAYLWIMLIGLAVCSFPADTAFGCRYNVRDVGFADLGSSGYHLYGYFDESSSPNNLNTFKQMAYAALLDTNIKLECIDVQEPANHPAMDYYRLHKINTTPAAMLVSPDGYSKRINITDSKNSMREALDEIVSSPVREDILEHIIKAYCVVLFVEGKNEAENKQHKKTVQAAVDDIAKIMGQMPKPLEHPPHLTEIPQKKFSQESILLWSLGLETHELSDPCVLILHGRARRIGPLLKKNAITKTNIFHVLSMIGLSCECGLDRKWMQGSMIPIVWGSEQQREVVQYLGFDAESPTVKMEISQILHNGPGGSMQRDAGDAVESILNGYSEVTLEFGDSGVETKEANLVSQIEEPISRLEEFNQSDSKSEMAAEFPFYLLIWVMGGLTIFILVTGGYILMRERSK